MDKIDEEIKRLQEMPDSEIDTSDIPEVTDWSKAEVGKFYGRINRKLFISFTGLLRHIKQGDVTPMDLRRGLFYFGCTREHALDPNVQEYEWIFKDDDGAKREAYLTASAAILLAENNGRCIWRQANESNTYEALNGLLVKHGYSYNRDGGPAICFGELDNRTENPSYSYCYPGVRDRVAEANIAITVVM